MFPEVIVGVNKYRLPEQESVDVLSIDNTIVREKQCARLAATKANRDPVKVAYYFFFLGSGIGSSYI